METKGIYYGTRYVYYDIFNDKIVDYNEEVHLIIQEINSLHYSNMLSRNYITEFIISLSHMYLGEL